VPLRRDCVALACRTRLWHDCQGLSGPEFVDNPQVRRVVVVFQRLVVDLVSSPERYARGIDSYAGSQTGTGFGA